jgi:hypothetical protein
MRFHLAFEGALPSSGNVNSEHPKSSKLKAIWAIRDNVNLQLVHLVATHHAFSGRSGASRALMHALIPPIVVDGHAFCAIARARFKVRCGLKIDLLVNHEPGSVITKAGDLDNRLKTLIDGLRVPAGRQEIKTFTSSEKLAADKYVCLLEDDVLITSLQIAMARNLAFPQNAGQDHVKANIVVTIEPSERTFENEAFQND